MAKRDCPIVLNRCGGQDSPITNTSSEDPDPVLFAGIGWTQFNPWAIPPIGDGPQQKVDCSDIVWSDVSQVMADLLAQINAAFCQPPPVPPLPAMPDLPPMPTFPPLPTGGVSVLACNDALSVTVRCFDGTEQTFNIPEGVACETVPLSYVSEYKAFINDWLRNWYTVQALINCPGEADTLQVCSNDRQEASVECPDGSVFSAAIEAGTVTSPPLPASLCAAWKEYANATLLAQLLQSLYNARVCTVIPNLNWRTPPGLPPGPPVAHPRISNYPGWVCVHDILDPAFNTYTIQGGGNTTWNFEITGQVPPGTGLTETGPKSAVLDGSPSVPGTYVYVIRATSGSQAITVTDTLHVLGLKSTTLDNGRTGVAYSDTLEADGGTAPYTFTGTAPSGLTLATDGTVSGTPTTAGTFTFEVTVTDSQGAFCKRNVTIAINSDCPDWATMVWDAPTVFKSGSASDTVFAFQNTFSVAATVTVDPADDITVLLNYGHLTGYNGHGCNCHVVLDRVFDPAASFGAFAHHVVIQRWNGLSWVTLLNHDWLSTFFDHQDVPFTVPDSLGTPYDIRVSVTSSATSLGGGPGTLGVSGTISNI